MHDRRFQGDIYRLRSAERLARLEVERVVGLCLEGYPIQSALDVGCGSGVFSESFAEKGLAVTGIDTNPEMIAAAETFIPSGKFELAPAEKIPFPDKVFDLVFLGLVLHETDDALKALQEAKRVCQLRTAILEWPYVEETTPPPLAHRLKAEDIRKMAQSAGFGEVQTVHLSHVELYLMK
jgi:ubiquinone/menaquinone biosynthesis C-methylase UbiE